MLNCSYMWIFFFRDVFGLVPSSNGEKMCISTSSPVTKLKRRAGLKTYRILSFIVIIITIIIIVIISTSPWSPTQLGSRSCHSSWSSSSSAWEQKLIGSTITWTLSRLHLQSEWSLSKWLQQDARRRRTVRETSREPPKQRWPLLVF